MRSWMPSLPPLKCLRKYPSINTFVNTPLNTFIVTFVTFITAFINTINTCINSINTFVNTFNTLPSTIPVIPSLIPIIKYTLINTPHRMVLHPPLPFPRQSPRLCFLLRDPTLRDPTLNPKP